MSSFAFDLKGQLNNIRLSEKKALWPLYEAIVNSIQSIEDSPNSHRGKIKVIFDREEYTQLELDGKNVPERIENITIIDNGAGLNTDNYNSFNTAYSTFKIKKGCKGIGRFLWLKAFKSVEVKSIYKESGKTYCREFTFTNEGIAPLANLKEITDSENETVVCLKGFGSKYRNVAPVDLETLAKHIVEHCLPFFLSEKCPEIVITDNVSMPINLNIYYSDNIKDTLHRDIFNIEDYKFEIYHLRLPSNVAKHELHLCANLQEVTSVELKSYIPDLQRKINPSDETDSFFYVGYLVSEYLDSIVNFTRTDFEFADKDALWAIDKNKIINASISYVRAYLSTYLADIEKGKKKRIDEYISNERPVYRFLVGKNPNVYKEIPAGLNNEALELELHKKMQEWEREVKETGLKLAKFAQNLSEKDDVTYVDIFKKYWEGINDLNKTSLAEYVTRRKTLLDLLDVALTRKNDGNFEKEERIHSLICPMRHTSDDVEFEEMNLWVIDERLAYHKYLASDKTLKSMPVVESNSTKEPDMIIFDKAFAYVDSEEPFNYVTIVEFKKPNNDSKNPLDQVGEYIDLIRDGKRKKQNGQSFTVSDGTLFRCYIVCDLTERMCKYCRNSNLTETPDKLGYTGFNHSRHASFEVISYKKLLIDAKKRNQILFDKLFSPNLSTVIDKI